MKGFYDNFLEKVAQSRHTTADHVHTLAQGRVWTGAQAKERGLVDALGGLDTAITIAKQRANIPADEDVEIVTYAGRRSFYEAVTSSFRGDASSLGLWSILAGPRNTRAVADVTAPARLFRAGEPLALMPFAFVR
jgi:protease-4